MTASLQRQVRVGTPGLPGELILPHAGCAVVVFAHGSGSSRLSPRNRAVAQWLHERGLGTLLFDLLTDAEAADRRNVFDIALLGQRVADALAWLAGTVGDAGVGLFGASTGAAAALVAAAAEPGRVAAVVSRGGRPDLAGAALPRVRAPTLLIVGALDTEVLALNRAALEQLACDKSLQIVPGATHLFEEPGTLQRAAALAGEWFTRHLAAAAS